MSVLGTIGFHFKAGTEHCPCRLGISFLKVCIVILAIISKTQASSQTAT